MSLNQSVNPVAGTGGISAMMKYVCIGLVVVLLSPLAALCAPERLVDSVDYKDKGFQKGCISDYSNLVRGDDADWLWINPGVKLANFKIVLGKFENKSEDIRSSQLDELKNIYKETFDKIKGDGQGALTADMCVYDYQKFSPGKAWIPFVGGHQMQAGIGSEVILKDKGNKIIAKVRIMSRAGSSLIEATEENASHLKLFFTKN